MTLYEMLWIFFDYSLLGWCTEVIFAASVQGKFVNRGLLNGPYCPIYGFGVLLVILILAPLKSNFLILFLGSIFLTTALEFGTGFVLEKYFGDKWWDYSGEPFNIKGYVCLRYSLLWGLACVVVVSSIYPTLSELVGLIPQNVGNVMLIFLTAVYASDTIITVMTINNLKKRLTRLEEVGVLLHSLSDRIGQPLAGTTLEFIEIAHGGIEDLEEKKDGLKDRLEDKRDVLEELYRDLKEQRSLAQKRLLTAFPDLSKGRYREIIKEIAENRSKRKNKV